MQQKRSRKTYSSGVAINDDLFWVLKACCQTGLGRTLPPFGEAVAKTPQIGRGSLRSPAKSESCDLDATWRTSPNAAVFYIRIQSAEGVPRAHQSDPAAANVRLSSELIPVAACFPKPSIRRLVEHALTLNLKATSKKRDWWKPRRQQGRLLIFELFSWLGKPIPREGAKIILFTPRRLQKASNAVEEYVTRKDSLRLYVTV